MKLSWIVVVSLLGELSGPARAEDLVEYLRDEVAAGRMGRSDAIYWKVAAVRNPRLLPDAFSKMALPRCGTPILMDAWQWLGKMEQPWKGETSRLFAPPDDMAYHLDATDVFPVRVSYQDPSQHELAVAIVRAVERSYSIEVEEFGWWPPPIEPADGLYRMYIDDIGQYMSGFTSPYAPVPETERSDAYTYIVFNASSDPRYVESTVAHEFNHALQSAMDAHEKTAFMENTAVFYEGQVSRLGWLYGIYMIPSFQKYPFLPLEYMGRTTAYGYEYGGVVWTWFLDEVYGEGRLAFVREIWEHCIQPDGTPNEPDYMDAIEELTSDRGGIAGVVKMFARYRYFMGKDDDGAHLEGAYRMWDGEVKRIDEWLVSELPVHDVAVPDQVLPQPNGCNYVQLDEDEGMGWDVRFTFDGDPSIPWVVQILQIPWHDLGSHYDMEIDEQGHGEFRLTPGVADRLIMIVCQIPGADYDPDAAAWIKGPYSYSIDRIPPAPVVESISPSSFAPGSQNVLATVQGAGFVYDRGLSVAFSGEGTAVRLHRVLSDRAIEVEVTVAQSAEPGPRDVLVTNPGGEIGVGQGLVAIEATEEEQDAGASSGQDPGPGRGCVAAGSVPLSSSWLWILLVLGLVSLRGRSGLWLRR